MPIRFKLLKGNHRVAGITDANGQRGEGRTYRQGETFESEIELDRKFGSEKFKRLKTKAAVSDPDDDEDEDDSDVDAQAQDDGLDAMTDTELNKFAEEAGVKTKGKKRETVIRDIRESLVNA